MADVAFKETVVWPQCKSALSTNTRRTEAVDELVDARLKDLSVEQKVAQLIQAELASIKPDDVRRFGLGSILNGGGVSPNANKRASIEDWWNLANEFQTAARESEAGIPIFWGTDAVHGHNNVFSATIFPHNIALGAANDSDLMERLGARRRQEML